MRSYLELITEWETFLKELPEGSLEDFAHFLLRPAEKANSVDIDPSLKEYFDKNTEQYNYQDHNSEASFLIWRLNKFLKNYTKSVFDTLQLNNQDEFAVLAHVDYLKECTKKTAVQDNLIDMSTGIDMIKRLINRGLLIDRPNPSDKRERLVRLSDKGRELLYKTYEGFNHVQNILVSMSVEEKSQFVSTLKKLDVYHTRHQSKE